MVEIDCVYFDGHIRPKNHKEVRINRHKATHQTGKRSVVVVARKPSGRTLSFVSETEEASVSVIAARITLGTTIHSDEAVG